MVSVRPRRLSCRVFCRRHHRPRSRRVLVEAQVRPRAHVVRDVVLHDAPPPGGTQYDHVIEAFTSDLSDEVLDVGVLPR